MAPRVTPSQSAEDYLERIHELIEEKGYARVVDIASSLKVRQASVTSMVQKLAEAGYLKYEKYRGLIMTDQGREVARRIQSRHETLSRFFSLFGIDAESQWPTWPIFSSRIRQSFANFRNPDANRGKKAPAPA